jgi:hypothetical protein
MTYYLIFLFFSNRSIPPHGSAAYTIPENSISNVKYTPSLFQDSDRIGIYTLLKDIIKVFPADADVAFSSLMAVYDIATSGEITLPLTRDAEFTFLTSDHDFVDVLLTTLEGLAKDETSDANNEDPEYGGLVLLNSLFNSATDRHLEEEYKSERLNMEGNTTLFTENSITTMETVLTLLTKKYSTPYWDYCLVLIESIRESILEFTPTK